MGPLEEQRVLKLGGDSSGGGVKSGPGSGPCCGTRSRCNGLLGKWESDDKSVEPSKWTEPAMRKLLG